MKTSSIFVSSLLRLVRPPKKKMTRFRPCIDLHAGQVKQIVGGTLDSSTSELKTNYVSKHPAGYYAKLYRDNALEGAHVIMLGPKNDEAAQEALAAWPGHLQVGGGINDKNAALWIERGASKVSKSDNAAFFRLQLPAYQSSPDVRQ